MAHTIILISGTAFLAGLFLMGWRLRRAGRDLKGKTPILRPFFLAGKAAMGIVWGLALWRAATALCEPGAPATWSHVIGAGFFTAGSGLALAAVRALDQELRFGLPTTDAQLKTNGLYGWSRHPIYSGFFLMYFGAGFYVGTLPAAISLLVAVGVHYWVAMAEERFLALRFGDTWRAYAARVPRYGRLLIGPPKRSGWNNGECN